MVQLLETVMKNCGDIVHMYVAEKDLLHKMVKIVTKKVLDIPLLNISQLMYFPFSSLH